MTRFAYFPGCSAEGAGCEYADTMDPVLRRLGHELVEIPDWNCCGASSAHAVSEYLSLALPGRDLVKAEEMGLDVVAPCAACFNRLARAAHELPRRQQLGGEALPPFRGDVAVVHPLGLLAEPASLRSLQEQIRQRLNGLRVVTYYGCQAVRPARVTGVTGSELENPTMMDRVLEALGARVVDWSHKTACCGAAQAMPKPEITQRLTLEIVDGAVDAGAEAIVTGCPLCFLNLEIQQVQALDEGEREAEPVPVLYISELMALALGVGPLQKGFRNHLIPVEAALKRRELSWP